MESLSPSPELRKQWIDGSPGIALDGHTRVGTDWNAVMDKAARWGADQELDACCQWLAQEKSYGASTALAIRHLRADRRWGLKKRALEALDMIQADFRLGHLGQDIRDALEAMPDD